MLLRKQHWGPIHCEQCARWTRRGRPWKQGITSRLNPVGKGAGLLQQPTLQRRGFGIMVQPFTKTEVSIIMNNNKFRELSKLFHFPLWKQKTRKLSIITDPSVLNYNISHMDQHGVNECPKVHLPRPSLPENTLASADLPGHPGQQRTGCVVRQTCVQICSPVLAPWVTSDALNNLLICKMGATKILSGRWC